MWTRSLCLICIYILRNYAFQISNEASFFVFSSAGCHPFEIFSVAFQTTELNLFRVQLSFFIFVISKPNQYSLVPYLIQGS